MTTSTRRTWVAAYDSSCATCTARIAPGDLYFIAPGGQTASGLDCCGDRDDADLVVTQRAEEDGGDDESPVTAIARVMPRGRTVGDACPKCWQVPASNGTCGCVA